MNPDIQPHELDAMKATAQKAPFDIQRQFLALVEAYEDNEGTRIALNEAHRQHEKIADVITQLKRLELPSSPCGSGGVPLSDDAWNEHLEELPTDGDRDNARIAELARARTREAALIARVAELEEGVAEAISALGEIEAPG